METSAKERSQSLVGEERRGEERKMSGERQSRRCFRVSEGDRSRSSSRGRGKDSWRLVRKEIVQGDFLHRACENIYEYVRLEDGTVSKSKFFEKLKLLGILIDDPRVAGTVASMEKHKFDTAINKQAFIDLVSKNITVIESAFTNSNIIHKFEDFSTTIRDMYHASAANVEGKVADYIPQYARQNPDLWAVSVCTTDGQRLNLGNSDYHFCIHSCIKPISYCMAIEEHGVQKVHKYVGREPSGVRFNALKVNHIGLPHNPLINSGAIMMCALIRNYLQPADRFDYMLEKWSALAGGMALGYSNSVYLSERGMGDRNYALAHYMKDMKAFPANADITDILQFYFQVTSLTINANYLAIVAASLANGGVCPLTGIQVFSPETVKYCLSLMYSCGMYEYSGEFAFNIGIPAKSGASGAIITVIPNVMGICTFSPRLDKYSNSVRGVSFFQSFIAKFNFHLFDNIEGAAKEDPRQREKQEEVTIEKINKYSSIGDISALKRLKFSRQDIALGDYDKRTPLHLAASNGHISVIKFLLQRFGNEILNPVDRWNGTPYDDALREQNFQVAEYLKAAGGKSGNELRTVSE